LPGGSRTLWIATKGFSSFSRPSSFPDILTAHHTPIVLQEVDIEDAATLFGKIAALSHAPGRRVAVIGDSLIFGFAMRAAGVPNWRDQNLTAKLRRRFADAHADISLANLGMNGALPADLEKVVDALIATGVDGIIMDVSLRSLSRDFAQPSAVFSRPWLRNFKITASGSLVLSDSRTGFDAAIESLAVNYWYTFRLRDQIRLYILGQEPVEFVKEARDWFNRIFKQPEEPLDPQIQLLLQTKARYENISLDVDNPQFAALSRLLKKIAAKKIATLIFYATERPDIIGSITTLELHRRRLSQLADVIRKDGGATVKYLGPLESLQSDEFIDHVHVLPSGYAKYAALMANEFLAISGGRRAP
jgi:hypothetical protein